ncbi:MAG: GNAT family N-acetyltransferase [Planctomycetota bacterium]
MLYDAQPPDQQPGLVAALETVNAEAAPDFRGLWIGRDDRDGIANAGWLQMLPGRTGVLWPPRPDRHAARSILESTSSQAREAGLSLAQTLVDPRDAQRRQLLAETGFPHLVDLDYLGAPADTFPREQPATPLRFQTVGEEARDRMTSAVDETYIDSLDCPKLSGVRSTGDVLEGYKHQGEHDPDLWFTASADGEDVGVLILARHPSPVIELVYMGVVPSARGNGWGHDIVRFAQWRSRENHAERLVLAVDASNEPALRMYTRAGFQRFQSKSVHAVLIPNAV